MQYPSISLYFSSSPIASLSTTPILPSSCYVKGPLLNVWKEEKENLAE